MYSLYGQYPCRYWGFPIRKSTDHNLFAVPRGLSQPITSFFGSQWQGIHPVLFLAWPSVCSASFCQTPQKTLISFSLFRGAERCSVRFYCFFAIVLLFARRTQVRLSLQKNDSLLKNLAEDEIHDTLYHYLGPYNYSLDLFTWIIWVSSVICSYWISIQLPAVTSSLK